MAKLTNDSNEERVLEVRRGEGFLQGIFMPYGITEDDCADGVRNGGFGSTDQNSQSENAKENAKENVALGSAEAGR